MPMRAFLANPFYRFLTLFLGLYAVWYALYEYVLQPYTSFDRVVINSIVSISSWSLNAMGYNLVAQDQSTGFYNWLSFLDGTGVIVGPECDGIVLLALFTVFMLSYQGPVKHKIWFTILGLISIHIVNVLRVTSLALISHHAPEYLAFNHDYTFTILVYGFVFALWYLWVSKWGNTSPAESPSKQ